MVRIMPLGDSITFGVVNNDTVNDQGGGYRTVLYDQLLSNGFTNNTDGAGGFNFVGSRDNTDPRRSSPNGIDPDYAGYRGWRIDELINGRPATSPTPEPAAGNITTWLATEVPDVVLLMIGTNDILQNVPIATAINGLSTLIDLIINAGAQALVASIPPLTRAQGTQVPVFNAAVGDLVATKGQNATFVDINSLLSANDISSDGIHITPLGYSKIATAWYDTLLPILDPTISPNIGAPRETLIAPTRIETEALTLTNFAAEAPNIPDTQVISIPFNGGVTTAGTATGFFAPPTPGRYDVVLGYFDENDAGGQLQVSVGNNVLPTLNLNQNLGSAAVTTQNFVRRTIGTAVLIDQTTPFTITGTSAFTAQGGGELVRVDYIEFVPINDAAVLDPLLVQNLTAIREDPPTNNGNLVSEILGNAVTDLDLGTVLGIAVTEVDNTNGTWQYSIDNGNGINWTNFGTPSAANARLLVADPTTRIRFVPNLDYNGPPVGITFRAWDQSRGFAGDTVDISGADVIAGSRAFSEASATVTITVNDAPLLNPLLVENLTPIDENPVTNNGDLVSNILGNAVSDPNTGALLGMAVIGVDNSNGTWQYSINNGSIWTAFGSPDATTARLLAAGDRIRFVPNPDYTGIPTGITFRAWDRTNGVAGETADISAPNATGETQPFSTAIASTTINVLPVNSTPVANDDSTTTTQNTAVDITVLANDTDADGDPLTLSLVTGASNGIAAINNNGTPNDLTDDSITYTPNPSFIGTDQFIYQVDDLKGGTDPATVNITVNPNPVPPPVPNPNPNPVPSPNPNPGSNPNPDPDGTSPPLRPGLSQNLNDIFLVYGSSGQTQLQFALTERNTPFVNEIGVFVVDDDQGTIDGIAPGAPGYQEAALRNAQVIFSVLPDGLGSTNPTRELNLDVGTRLGFYLVQNSTTDAVLNGENAPVFFGSPLFNPNGTDYLQVSNLSTGGFTLAWSDQSGGGNQTFDDIVLTVQAIAQNQPLPVGARLQGTEQGELIDLSDQVGQVANFNYQVSSKATYDNTIGLYVVEDEQGTVIDPVTGNRLTPGQVGYEAAAIQRTVFQAGEDATGSVQLGGGVILAPYIIADGTPDQFLAQNPGNQQGQGPFAYFAYLGANPDGVDHVRLLGDNTFGCEDLFGGGDRDYNDIVLKIDISVT